MWNPIETAPTDTSVLLYCNDLIPIYCGRKRYGELGEPQQDVFAWRCDSSGRFANPTYWMPLPTKPDARQPSPLEQKPNEQKPLDPAVLLETLQRDDFTQRDTL